MVHYYTYRYATGVVGYSYSLWSCQVSIYASVLFIVNFKLKLQNKFFDYYLTWVIFFLTSYFLFFMYVIAADYWTGTKAVYSTLYMLRQPFFYLLIILSLGLIIFDYAIRNFSDLVCIIPWSQTYLDLKLYFRKVNRMKLALREDSIRSGQVAVAD